MTPAIRTSRRTPGRSEAERERHAHRGEDAGKVGPAEEAALEGDREEGELRERHDSSRPTPYFAGSATTVWTWVSPENMTIGATTPDHAEDGPGDQCPQDDAVARNGRRTLAATRKNAPATIARSRPSRATRTITITSSRRKTLGR